MTHTPDSTPDETPDETAAATSEAIGATAEAGGATAQAPTPWHKLHPLTPVIDGGLVLIIIVGIIIANLRDIFINAFFGDQWDEDFDVPEEVDGEWDFWGYMLADGHWVIAILIVVGIILLVLGIAWLSWFFHSYQINDRAVEMRKGVLIKKHRRAPLERIQSVNLQRPLIARLFGLTKIEVQTGGADGALNLAYLTHAQAKVVRQQILRTASDVTDAPSGSDAGESDGSQPEGTQLGVSPSVAPERGARFVDTASSEVERRAQEFVDFDVDADEPESVVHVPHGRLVGSILLSHEAIAVYIAVIVLPILGVTVSWGALAGLIPAIIAFVGIMISRFNRGFNFTLSYSSSGIRTGSGLTSTSTDTIPRHRIHAVDVSQPIWWKPFGWWRIRLTTAGGAASAATNQKALENVVLPVGKRDDVLKVLGLLFPTLENEGEAHWIVDALEGPGTGFTGAGRRSGWVLWFGKKRAGISIAHGDTQDAMVRIRRGIVSRHLVLMPIVRSQSVMVQRPLVHRFLGLASLTIHTVPGPVFVMIRGLALDDARSWWNYLSATIIRVQQADQRPQYGVAEAPAQVLHRRHAPEREHAPEYEHAPEPGATSQHTSGRHE